MIALIRGTLARVADDHVVIDTGGESGGVGYEVFCHLRTIATLHASHEPEIQGGDRGFGGRLIQR